MKKLTTKLISFILTLSMIFSLAVPAFAAENYSSAGTSVNTQEEIEAAREAYNALTPEAQAIFDASLAYDQDMLEFHKTYVDASFKLPTAPRFQTRSSIAANDPMRVLMIQLNAIGLPSSVLYSLKAMGAGMVAALADGPLPVGDILLAAATASTVVVIGANWDKVSPKFNQITKAFQTAFSSTASNVSKAFAKVKTDARVKYAEHKEKQNYNLSADKFISKFRKASIRGKFPKELLPFTVKEIEKKAQQGERAAKTAWKLLTDGRFKK